MTDNPATTQEAAFKQRVSDVMALAIELCHYHAPGCPYNSCCGSEPRCLAKAWEAKVAKEIANG